MAQAYRLAGRQSPLAATETVLYTVPDSVDFISSTLSVCNRNTTGAPAAYRIAVVPNGEVLADKHYLIYENFLDVRKNAKFTIGLSLTAGDQVIVQTDTVNVTFILFGHEIANGSAAITTPVLVGFLDITDNIVGKYYNQDIKTLFSGTVDYYSLSNALPAGLILDSQAGVVRGWVTRTGVSSFGVIANRLDRRQVSNLETTTISSNVPNQEPSWISAFTLFPMDSDGFSILAPSATSRVIYVSETGNDVTGAIYTSTSFPDIYNPTGELAFATIAAAYANVRWGEDDWVLIKRGETFVTTAYLDIQAGRSTTERSVITAYGDVSLSRPVVKCSGDYALRAWQVVSNIAILSIDFYAYRRDPLNPDFIGWTSVLPMTGFFVYVEDSINSHFLIEDCIFRFLGTGMEITGGSFNEVSMTDVVVRRCLFLDSYSKTTNSAGSYFYSSSVLLEDNLFDHCGWYDETNARASIYNHSVYASAINKDCIYRNNISIRPSSMHFKWTSNPPLIDSAGAYTLAAALVGAAETSVNVSFIHPDTPQTGMIKIALNSTAIRTVNYTSWTGTIYTIEATDFTLDNASIGNKTAVDILLAQRVSMHGNCFIEGQIGSSFGGNDANGLGHRFKDFNFTDNIHLHVGRVKRGTTSDIGWGAEVTDVIDAVVSHNYFLHVDRATAVTYVTSFNGYVSNVSVYGNHSYSANKAGYSPAAGVNKDNNNVYNNAKDLAVSYYYDPTRNVVTYMRSLGLTPTLEAYIAECRLQRKGYWRTEFTAKAINDYIKEGFVLTSVEPVLTLSPSPLLPNEPDPVTLNSDAVGNGAVAFQWYKNDAIIPGATDNVHNIPSSIAGTNDVYKCQATDINGNILTDTANVIVDPPLTRPLLTYSGSSYCTATGLTLNNNEGFGFTFKAAKPSFFFSSTSATHSISLTSNTNLNVRIFSSQFNFTLPAVDFAHKHTVKFKRTAGVPVLIFDGVAYPERTGLVFSSAGAVNVVGGSVSGATPVPVPAANELKLWDITIYDAADAVKLKYDIDTGGVDLETEAASVGTGTLTFKGVLAGDWVNLP